MKNALILTFLMLTVYYTLSYRGVLPEGIPLNATEVAEGQMLKLANKSEALDVGIVGTSRASTLLSEYFSTPVSNLAIPGEASTTGLAALLDRQARPHILIVETSAASLREFAKHFPVAPAQEKLVAPYSNMTSFVHRPINVTFAILQKAFGRKDEAIPASLRAAARANALRGNELTGGVKDQLKFHAVLAQAKTMIDQLQHSGTRVILFDIPADPVVRQVLKPYNDTVRRTFPARQYEWLDLTNEDCDFVDLTHPTAKSSKHLAGVIDAYIAKGPKLSTKQPNSSTH